MESSPATDTAAGWGKQKHEIYAAFIFFMTYFNMARGGAFTPSAAPPSPDRYCMGATAQPWLS